MKKLIDSVPLILFISIVPKLFYGNTTMPQSVIVAVVAALLGYRYYLESLVKPDYEKIFSERLDKAEKYTDDSLKKLLYEINEVKATQGKLSIVQSSEERVKNFKW